MPRCSESRYLRANRPSIPGARSPTESSTSVFRFTIEYALITSPLQWVSVGYRPAGDTPEHTRPSSSLRCGRSPPPPSLGASGGLRRGLERRGVRRQEGIGYPVSESDEAGT